MFDRISIKKIFKRHFNTFYDYGELETNGVRKTPWQDKIIFIVFPVVISIALILLKVFFVEFYISVIVTCLALFIGLLFNFLTLIYQIVNKLKSEAGSTNDYKVIARFKLSKELFINVSFAIALSILCIASLLLTQFRPSPIVLLLKKLTWFNYLRWTFGYCTNFIAYLFIIEFIFTLLMILRRFFILFEKEFKDL